jgi:DNA polymerase-1
MYKEYKANRSPMPDEMQEQLPHLWEMLESMNIPVLKKPGVEADDIIGTLAVQADKAGLDTFIVSSDKDFMQLMNEHIFMLAPGNRKSPGPIIYDPKKVEEKWGVPPNKIIDLLGLMGDSSDNVPGVAGVGEKTAVKLIKAYGSLEGALENADKITNKRVHSGLKDGVEKAILSKELVTILTDVKLACEVNELKKREMDIDACTEKFTELEFHGLIKQLAKDSNYEVRTSIPAIKKDYKTILSVNELDVLVK